MLASCDTEVQVEPAVLPDCQTELPAAGCWSPEPEPEPVSCSELLELEPCSLQVMISDLCRQAVRSSRHGDAQSGYRAGEEG